MDGLIRQNKISDEYTYLRRPKLLSHLVKIVFLCFNTTLWLIASAICLPFFLLGLFVWGVPPTVPLWSRICRYFTAVFAEGKPQDSVPFTNRVKVFFILCNFLVKVPINGVCWFLDELLYPDYHKVEIKEPVFFITAPRSGSTQLGHYIEDDKENFIIPTVAEGMIPYIWAWKLLIPMFINCGLKQKQFEDNIIPVGLEVKKHHEFKFFKSDSWCGTVQSWHFCFLSWCFGSSFMKWGYSYAKLNHEPIDEELYHKTFMLFTDRVVKKVMYYRGNPKQHVFLEGHFLIVAKTLQQQYPDARFFAVARQPLDRFRSFANLIRVVMIDGPHARVFGLFPTPWNVIRDYVISTQIPYCEQEMSFYKDDQENKLVIPFTLFVNDLSTTLKSIYNFCNIPIPDHVVSKAVKLQRTSHNRVNLRTNYHPSFNRSLSSLGVDEEQLTECLAEYIAWINQLENSKKFN